MKFSVKDITLIAILGVLLFASQVLTSPLPNINLITFLLIIYTYQLGFIRAFLTAQIFTLLMGSIYGFGTYIIGYVWIYTILIIIAFLLKKVFKENEYLWAIFAGLFGLSFGFLFAINEYVFMGLNLLVYWINGLIFDIIHMVGNFILTIILFKPILKVFKSLLEEKYENIH